MLADLLPARHVTTLDVLYVVVGLTTLLVSAYNSRRLSPKPTNGGGRRSKDSGRRNRRRSDRSFAGLFRRQPSLGDVLSIVSEQRDESRATRRLVETRDEATRTTLERIEHKVTALDGRVLDLEHKAK